jgi:excisionase family DNA binding protein
MATNILGGGEDSRPMKLLLTPDEAAAALGVGRTLLYELLMSKEIMSLKLGRVRRVPMTSLVEYIAKRVSEAA